jgi:hypothetical protein
MHPQTQHRKRLAEDIDIDTPPTNIVALAGVILNLNLNFRFYSNLRLLQPQHNVQDTFNQG